jgi:hypothetical protein
VAHGVGDVAVVGAADAAAKVVALIAITGALEAEAIHVIHISCSITQHILSTHQHEPENMQLPRLLTAVSQQDQTHPFVDIAAQNPCSTPLCSLTSSKSCP